MKATNIIEKSMIHGLGTIPSKLEKYAREQVHQTINYSLRRHHEKSTSGQPVPDRICILTAQDRVFFLKWRNSADCQHGYIYIFIDTTGAAVGRVDGSHLSTLYTTLQHNYFHQLKILETPSMYDLRLAHA